MSGVSQKGQLCDKKTWKGAYKQRTVGISYFDVIIFQINICFVDFSLFLLEYW